MTRDQLETLVKSLHKDAFLWARQCCGFDGEMARDVLQHVYLKILEGKATFHHQSAAKTWLFSVIRYTSLEWIRKKPAENSLPEIIEIEDPAVVQQEPVSHEALIQLLLERQKEVLLLVFYHGLTLEKAAHIMQVGLGTARTHYDRGKKNLKCLILKEREHEDSK
ncbi:RNA polymerase sigma-70 factor, ECF subfamily [Cyclobacterium xiamenense]|uniref:RNA polymerase sigma-70 factor, ECF subfamily n=1 Tax=Cyclobacterium xiamenense TaxID=1297121 RepID=A0A1H6ZU13_9BACT|nr:RNA polymerase sigma factor [Cyclobacterium xiamenense]SEJ55097.1 RNA polymerase sigma-70 factor, ECF subfamily [Cyclobacterium xiamenense]